MHFFSEIKVQKIELEKMGFSVLMPSEEGTDIEYSLLSELEQINLKQQFIDTHLAKISSSDAILVANYTKNGVENYIGANSFLEIVAAYLLKKKIFLLHAVPDQSNKIEIQALRPIELQGDLKKN